MAFFGVMGKYVAGSGFEEIIFQAGICSSGSISGVISGKQYNRCWAIHEAFSEALERLFMEAYIPEVAGSLQDFARHQPGARDIISFLDEPDLCAYVRKYEELKRRCLEGDLGKTAQFWSTYMMMVDRQQKLHYAINTNNVQLRLQMWKVWLPMCFATNRVHYSRYGTYYVKSLEYLESTHPGAAEEIKKVVSVRRNTNAIGQAVDMAGEQSYMKSAKTAGKLSTRLSIINFQFITVA